MKLVYNHYCGVKRSLKDRLMESACNTLYRVIRRMWILPTIEIRQFWMDGRCIDDDLPKDRVILLKHKYGEDLVRWYGKKEAERPAFYHPDIKKAREGLLILGSIERWEIVE